MRPVDHFQRPLRVGGGQLLGAELGIADFGAQFIERDLALLVDGVDRPRLFFADGLAQLAL
ncbi:MAG TPA: hypothetical protein VKU82_05420, partial [Planctomycetaceae bacterium]|nr:hypothetical protein [Planctomycetaceae bacterium]